MLILRLPNQKLDQQADGWFAKLKQLDPIGNLVFFPGVVCLVLALQWGGSIYSWKDARIIVLLILCGILIIAFIFIQIHKQDNGTVPPRIVKNRSIAASIWFTFFNGAGMMILMYYLPIWFQAIKGVSAVKSGIMLLPLVLSTVVSSIVSGVLVSKIGYYTPFFLLSSILSPIGGGLISTFTPTTNHSMWIGYQVLFGFSLGLGMQQPMNVLGTVLDRTDVSTGTAVIFFVRFLGAAIFVPVAENVFVTQLIKKLQNLPGISPDAVAKGGATAIRQLVSGADLGILLHDYNDAIVDVFYIVIATSAITIFGSVLVEWKSLKKAAEEEKQRDKAAKEGQEKQDTESKDLGKQNVEKHEAKEDTETEEAV